MAEIRRLKRPSFNPEGREEMQPTDVQRQTVLVLAGMSVPIRTIAQNLNGLGNGVDPRTLKKHFSLELETGKAALTASLKSKIVSAAMNGSVRAQTWLLERLDPEAFAPRYRKSDDELGSAAAVADLVSSEGARVEIYLPDNERRSSDHESVVIDVESEKS